MIHYVVVTGTPAAIERLRPLLLPALHRTRCFEGNQIEQVGASRTWAVGAIAMPDPMRKNRLAVSDDAMAVVNGPALATGGDQTTLTEDVLKAYSSGGADAAAAKLAGGYNFVGVAPAQGLRAFADFSGIAPLYWHQGEDFAAISNRTAALAALTGDGWNLPALAWVLGTGTLYGEQMPLRAARYLPPGVEARVEWGRERVTIARSPVWLWPEPSKERGRDNLTSAEWDEIAEELTGNFRAMRGFGRPVRLSLSGGKDSRLCLALAKAAGLDDIVLLRTNGPADSPEVECAAAVARAAGLPHERIAPPTVQPQDAPEAAQELSFEPWWRRLRQHVYRYEGVVSPWDGMTNPMRSTTLNVRGIGGELFRRGNVKRIRKSQARSTKVFARLHGAHVDPLGALRSGQRAFQDDWRAQWFDVAADNVRFDLLPEKWYVDYRMGHWNGPLAQSKPGYINVVPLLSPAAARKNMELSVKARSSDRFHFEVMLRAAPELVQVPFLGDTWAPSIAATSPVDLPQEPFPVQLAPTEQVLNGPKWRFIEAESDRICEILSEAERETRMGDLCDLATLRTAVRADGLKGGEVKELFSSIGVAIALLGRAEPAIDVLPQLAPDETGS